MKKKSILIMLLRSINEAKLFCICYCCTELTSSVELIFMFMLLAVTLVYNVWS